MISNTFLYSYIFHFIEMPFSQINDPMKKSSLVFNDIITNHGKKKSNYLCGVISQEQHPRCLGKTIESAVNDCIMFARTTRLGGNNYLENILMQGNSCKPL